MFFLKTKENEVNIFTSNFTNKIRKRGRERDRDSERERERVRGQQRRCKKCVSRDFTVSRYIQFN